MAALVKMVVRLSDLPLSKMVPACVCNSFHLPEHWQKLEKIRKILAYAFVGLFLMGEEEKIRLRLFSGSPAERRRGGAISLKDRESKKA